MQCLLCSAYHIFVLSFHTIFLIVFFITIVIPLALLYVRVYKEHLALLKGWNPRYYFIKQPHSKMYYLQQPQLPSYLVVAVEFRTTANLRNPSVMTTCPKQTFKPPESESYSMDTDAHSFLKKGHDPSTKNEAKPRLSQSLWLSSQASLGHDGRLPKTRRGVGGGMILVQGGR